MRAGDATLTRRQLLGYAGGAVALAAAARLPLPSKLTARPPGVPTLAQMLPHVGSRFEVVTDRGRTTLTLMEATGLPSRGQDGRQIRGEAFSLLFAPDGPTPVTGGTYTFRHAALGRFPLFVGPVGAGQSGPRLEAIINTLAPAG